MGGSNQPPCEAKFFVRSPRRAATRRVVQLAHEHAVQADALVRRFGDVLALDCVSLGVRRGEFFSLLGPSGCGKTTFLRIVAGLDAPDSGTLSIAGREALSLPPNRRPVNTVFQSYALFPHMTVQDNVAFGLKMKKMPRAEVETRVRRALDLTQITNLAARKPHQISGGQKQRVALARALVNEPDVLLLDEPLGALDVKLRRELQQELHTLQRRLGITFIHVTHDQDEALGLSDRIAVMDAGRVAQLGNAREIYEQPRNRFVAQFVGGCNLIEGTAHGNVVKTSFGELRINSNASGKLTLALRPEKIIAGSEAPVNQFSARVTDTTYTGAETHALLDVNGFTLKAVAMNTSGTTRIETGETTPISIPPDALLVLED
jgi:spermidine/putrescine transport system ATP-binding protein